MRDLSAPLSSAQSSLEELTKRIAGIAAAFEERGREEIAAGLYEVERNLQAAVRRLTVIEREM